MKKNLFVVIICALFIPILATAQQGQARGRSAEERAKKQTEQMTKQLNLNETQQAQVAAINLKYAQKVDDMRGTGREQQAERREALKQMDEQKEQELQGVLTAEQFAQFKQAKDERRAKMQERAAERKNEGKRKPTPRGRGKGGN
jgi:Spy/CpxP family protein refolding chaperone